MPALVRSRGEVGATTDSSKTGAVAACLDHASQSNYPPVAQARMLAPACYTNSENSVGGPLANPRFEDFDVSAGVCGGASVPRTG
jgi:hypothetical protein